MNCLESRRLLLSAPRPQSFEHQAHVGDCDECGRLAARLVHLDREIEEAARVPAPDALAHRILLARDRPPVWRYAAAAMLFVASAVVALAMSDVIDPTDLRGPIEAVGPTHPAVAAIALVVDEDSSAPAYGRSVDPAELEQGLKRLGLTLKHAGVKARYVGKCHLPGSDCDHIVVDTRDGAVNVVLVTDYPVPGRVLVSDRRMIALVSPARKGGLIVVAESPKVAKRTEKLFVKG